MLVAFVLSLVIIENVDEELEYLHFVKCAFALVFYATLLVVHFIPQPGYLLLVVPFLCLFLEQLGMFKVIFEIKYNMLLDRVSKHEGDQDLVILLEIVGGAYKMKADGV